MEIHDGIPWTRPPDWLDPEQRLIRNTYPSDAHHIRHLGTQLRLNFGDATSDDPDPPIDKAA